MKSILCAVVCGCACIATADECGLPSAVLRYGAVAEVSFKVEDTDGKPVAGAEVCGVETDASGSALYRGIVLNGRLQVSVSAPDIYSPAVNPLVLSDLSEDKRSFLPTNAPVIVVRRKAKPHAMVRGSINVNEYNRGRALVERRDTDYFGFSFGLFTGFTERTGYATLTAGYSLFEPKSPEDGFQEVAAFPDSLGHPLVAPADGYKNGAFETMYKARIDNEGQDRVRYVAFRHKTPEGFVYGVLTIKGKYGNRIDYVVNTVAGELSLEPEDAR